MRIAPSVDNGVGAGFGQREVLNRMQLVLRTLDITSPANSTLLVTGYINGYTFAGQQSILGTNTGAAIAISAASNTANVTTYTTGSTAHGLKAGNQVIISSMGGTGYNGTFVVTSVVSSTQFTVSQTTVSGTPGTGSLIAYAKWTNAVGDAQGTLTSSLAQIADYAPSTGVTAGAYVTTGGEVTGGFFVSATSSIDLTKLRDLGNSILGGGGIGSPAYSGTNIYPDGPDVLTIVVTNLGASAVAVLGRLAWTEAQA